jgi:hypothetical protein
MNQTRSALSRLALAAACAFACAFPCAAPAAQVSSGWSGADRVQGSGNVTREARQVGHFNGLALAVPGKLELRMGDTEGVTVETDDNIQPLIETVVTDGTLHIRAARRNLEFSTRSLRIVVQARSVERIGLAGSGAIDAGPLRTPRLAVDVSGSGSITLAQLDAGSLAVTSGGSGDVKAGGGSARQVSVSIAGSGNVELGQVRAESASVQLAGSGSATVWPRSALSMTIVGSGDVNYYGDPALSKSVLGSGGARRLGAAPR